MADWQDQEREQRKQLVAQLNDLQKFDKDKLQRKELGEYSFRSTEQYLNRIFAKFKQLIDLDLNEIPYQKIVSLNNSLTNYINRLNELLSFSPTKESNPNAKFEDLIRLIREMDNQSFDVINPLFNHTQDLSSQSNEFKKEAEKILEQAIETLNINQKEIFDKSNQLLKTLGERQKEIDRLSEIAKGLAESTSIAHHAEKFDEEADNNNKIARWWLGFTIGLGVTAVIFAILNLTKFKDLYIATDLAQSIQFIFAKLVIFSILYYGIVFCSRNYKANRHNFIVNKHRFNALKTFEAFVAPTSGDPQTKNAVLLRTTETIFSPAVTGYLSKEPDNQGSPAIMEIIRSVVKGDGTP